MILVQLDWQKFEHVFLKMKFLQTIQNDSVVSFNDVICIAHFALNIESTQAVAILKFEWTL